MISADQIYKVLHERNAVQRRIARATFEIWQRLGFHVVGDHFYDIVPNTHTIRRSYLNEQRDLPAISVDWLALTLGSCHMMGSFVEEYLHNRSAFGYREDNYYFSGLDALYYYSFIRNRKPSRIVEIGQGFSTRIALAALTQNQSAEQMLPEIISIDPYTRLATPSSTTLKYSVIQKPLSEIGKDVPGMLAAGDLLFVDSSHVFKFGSDVQLLFEHIYPRLAVGVLLHVHDIFSPFDYPLNWMVKRKQFWNEQYFLEAFLSFNRDFRIEAPLHFLARNGAADRMLSARNIRPDIVSRQGQSLYLVRT